MNFKTLNLLRTNRCYMTGILQFIIWIALIDHSQVGPTTHEDDYRAAIYSMQMDMPEVNLPEMQLMVPGYSTVTYIYLIQYGKDMLIEIDVPGKEIKSFSCVIKKFDYTNRQFTHTIIMDHAKRYGTSRDTIAYSIEESKGSITDLCDQVELNSRCDSVNFILNSNQKEYKVIFNDTLANLRSAKLFYPDIKYLPYKIIGVGRQGKNTMVLEEVVYGKDAIDRILQFFDYEGYKEIVPEDIDPAFLQSTKELIEKLKNRE